MSAMPTVILPSASRIRQPVHQDVQIATSAGEVARTYADHATKKVLSVLHIPEKLSNTASVVSLQDSNLRAQKLAMKADIGDSGGLYSKQKETDVGSLVLSTNDSAKKLEKSSLFATSQEDNQLAARRVDQAQVLAACEAYRVMQRSENQAPLSRKITQTVGGIISTIA